MKFIIHNFKATIKGSEYDFDFYEYRRKGMIVGESPDLDLAILLPSHMSGHMRTYMFGAIKNYFNNMGCHSSVRLVGSLSFNEEAFL